MDGLILQTFNYETQTHLQQTALYAKCITKSYFLKI